MLCVGGWLKPQQEQIHQEGRDHTRARASPTLWRQEQNLHGLVSREASLLVPHGERAPAPRGGSDARGRNHGSHIDSPARVFVSDESSPCGTSKLALRSPVRADFAHLSLIVATSKRGLTLAQEVLSLRPLRDG